MPAHSDAILSVLVQLRTILFIFVLILCCDGCGSGDRIRRYRVESPTPKDRMLAAIVPAEDLAWFFKVSGPNQALGELTETFFEFIGSVKMSQKKPNWTLPDGWESSPATGMRFATIRIKSSAGPVELSVTSLPKMADEDQLLLDNINRWRGQLKLPPLTPGRLSSESIQMKLDETSGLTATVVNMVGNLTGSGMSSAPFASNRQPPRASGPTMPRAGISRKTVSFDTPEGWQAKDRISSRGGITIERDAVFGIEAQGEQVEVTVTQLPSSADVLVSNINRWRGEVGLEPVTDAETEKVEVGGMQGDLLELLGDTKAVLGVIAIDQGMGLFIKLQGDRDLALRERDRFREFVGSIQLSTKD